ncbi:MAG: YdcF family protein [Patescibacteria group bacterium]|jgi:uncharacterized SAM-binding protein YcdF (DUF218 family)
MENQKSRDKKLLLIKQSGLVLVSVFFFLYAFTATSIYLFSRGNRECEADTAVVLGSAVFGNVPSPVFEERINHAINLYNEGKVRKIIFTGGRAEEDSLSEAEAARDYALARGVGIENILIETESWTTYSNLSNTKKIVETENLGKVMIISDPLHIKRAEMMAEGLDIDACTSGTPTTRFRTASTIIPFLIRETHLYLQHYLIKI